MRVRHFLLTLLVVLTSCDRAVEDGDGLSCGPGTVVRDGACVPDNCGDGTALLGTDCVSLDLQFVALPVPAGQEAFFGQTFHGYFSHNGAGRYAVDMPMAEGSLVVAARAGRVVALKEDSNTGCADASCVDEGNYVVLDHGDGTRADYVHLQQNGALVELGDTLRN